MVLLWRCQSTSHKPLATLHRAYRAYRSCTTTRLQCNRQPTRNKKEPQKMPLKLTQATPHDAPRIANIHMQAFQTNALLHAQFPTPAAREGLRTTLAQRVIDEIKAPSWTILVAKRKRACDNLNSSEESQLEGEGEGEGEVVGFAKWHRSESKSESESDGDGPESDPPWIWPEGARIAVLDRWGERVDAAARRVLGKRGTTYSSRGRPCYREYLNTPLNTTT